MEIAVVFCKNTILSEALGKRDVACCTQESSSVVRKIETDCIILYLHIYKTSIGIEFNTGASRKNYEMLGEEMKIWLK